MQFKTTNYLKKTIRNAGRCITKHLIKFRRAKLKAEGANYPLDMELWRSFYLHDHNPKV